MKSKGYIYTVVSLMLGLVLLAVVSLYFESIKNASEIEPGKVRTDELHYFVESTKIDISRAMEISGRRGAVYTVGYVIYYNKTLTNASAAIAEAVVNGTITEGGETTNLTYMTNHTLNHWFRKIKDIGDKIYFDANISVSSIEIYPFDAFNFLQIVSLEVNITDKGGVKSEMCNYYKSGLKYYTIVYFDGVEDPFIPLRTMNKVRRWYAEGFTAGLAENIVNGTDGYGLGGGFVLDLSQNKTSAEINTEITNYNSTNPNRMIVQSTAFLVNLTGYTPSPAAKSILESSGGVINREAWSPAGPTYPYISGTGQVNLSGKAHLLFYDSEAPMLLYLMINDDLENKTYYRSPEGPSFFDRLEGRTNLSELYLNQSIIARDKMGAAEDENIGLEGFINVEEFDNWTLYGRKDESGTWCCQILPDYSNQSSVDYEYFNETYGRRLYGTPWWMRLDGEHINRYNLTQYVNDEGAVLSYHFEESGGSTAYSSTRAPASLSLYGPARTTEGKQGSCLWFNGTTDWAGLSPSLNDESDWTVSFWMNASGSGSIYSEGIPSATFFIEYDAANKRIEIGSWNKQTFILTGDYWVYSNSPNDIIEPDSWYFIAVTLKDGGNNTGTLDFYVNGTKASTGGLQMEYSPDPGWEIEYAAIGDSVAAHYGSTEPSSYFEGSLDEFKIWARALSAEEIMDEYASNHP